MMPVERVGGKACAIVEKCERGKSRASSHFPSENTGGDSGIRTPDLRIMIPFKFVFAPLVLSDAHEI